nr:PREDICTED: spermatogenesis associated 6-like protein isoform X2 [Latimeria chalumnae]|eukprot:XP_005998934.1 PREDICTED: spermatogenesis associated 6-like protein isoform X2 [Latimeria chalumnae]
MPRKVLKVVVELHIHAVTCPGVFLADKDDVYLSICILDQYRKTACLSPIFPLLIHEKMTFEKVFPSAVDPAAVAELLEIGEVLAYHEENTRDFLFPEPKLTPTYPGVDREVLMNRLPIFHGIAPKLEFSTRTTIKDFMPRMGKGLHEHSSRKANGVILQRATSESPKKVKASPTKKKKSKGHENPPRSSQSRSSSPLIRRHMCELTEDNQEWLAQLNLGTSEMKPELDTRPPFVVKHVDNSEKMGSPNSPRSSPKSSRSTQRKPRSGSSSPKLQLNKDLAENCRSKNHPRRVVKKHHHLNILEDEQSSVDSVDFNYSLGFRQSPDDLLNSSPLSSPLNRLSPALNCSDLPQRLSTDLNSSWEQIQERVCSLLTTHNARQRLSFGATASEIDDVLVRRSVSRNSVCSSSLERRCY